VSSSSQFSIRLRRAAHTLHASINTEKVTFSCQLDWKKQGRRKNALPLLCDFVAFHLDVFY
jgi:hypothetical protein